MIEKLEHTPATLLEIWMVSAAIIALGLGAMSDISVRNNAPYILLFGLLMHAYAMFRIYSK